MMWRVASLALALAAWGCGAAPLPQPAQPGVIQVQFAVQEMNDPAYMLSSGTVGFESIEVFGNVSTSTRGRLGPSTLDATLPGQRLTLPDLPDGLYSRLRLDVESLTIAGTWRGVPLRVQFEIEEAKVDLRLEAGAELAAGQSITFAVAVAAPSWLASVDLSQAVVDNGEILVDADHNRAIARAIAVALLTSFTLPAIP
jgi:hypothetical protein